MKYFIGVDVGTNSIRVGLFNQTGELIDSKVEPIHVYNVDGTDLYEQSSDEIWSAICKSIAFLCNKHGGEIRDNIETIGFDATCSLVVLDDRFQPIAVNPARKSEQNVNVIMWMDHRAKEQAEYINSLGCDCLRTVGGKISPEMDPPKILWLKQHFNECFNRAAHFFSLPDYLVWRATNVDARSVCTTTCKWMLKSELNKKEWSREFWTQIGLEELTENNFSRIGSRVEKPFTPCDDLTISSELAQSTGLGARVKVGISMIDAHAGGIGALALTLGSIRTHSDIPSFEDVLVLVSGTSSCFMATSREASFVSGIWGPYYDAMVPGMWLNEAGQSAAGKLIDHLIMTHPAYHDLKKMCENRSVYEVLYNLLEKLADEKKLPEMAFLTKSLHVYPDFHGNRSPLADPQMSGTVTGLSFDQSVSGLAVLYLSTIQSLAYQSRHILEKLNENGVTPKLMTIIGGLAQNRLYCQTLCDVCSIPILIPDAPETSVIFGSAILGAANCDEFKDLSFRKLIENFARPNHSAVFLSPLKSTETFHRRKYVVYRAIIDDLVKYRHIMDAE